MNRLLCLLLLFWFHQMMGQFLLNESLVRLNKSFFFSFSQKCIRLLVENITPLNLLLLNQEKYICVFLHCIHLNFSKKSCLLMKGMSALKIYSRSLKTKDTN